MTIRAGQDPGELPHDILAEPLHGVRYARLRINRHGELQHGGLSYGGWSPADGTVAASCGKRHDHDAPDPAKSTSHGSGPAATLSHPRSCSPSRTQPRCSC